MKRLVLAACALSAATVWGQEKGGVIEEIVARVNNEIITRSELERAQNTLADDAKQDCPRCTPEQLQNIVVEREKNVLRDLIDQSLLIQRAKDMGISVETELVKRLDEIRQTNKFPDMDEFERRVTAQGTSWEDFKSQIRNNLLTQRVIGQEVSRSISIGREEVEKYYNEHKKEFVRPEQVALREMFVSTEGKKETEIPDLEKKAKGLLDRVKNGEDFGELAKRFSDGSTAKTGGFLGLFKRGELSKELEDTAFKMKKNDLTDVIQTKQGFLVLQILEHYDEGEQAMAKVENEIMDRLYQQRMEPAYREYLKTLRQESYVIVKPGFNDTGGIGSVPIQEVQATPEANKGKKGRKKFLVFGKRKEAT